jgi:hypothetical protein
MRKDLYSKIKYSKHLLDLRHRERLLVKFK